VIKKSTSLFLVLLLYVVPIFFIWAGVVPFEIRLNLSYAISFILLLIVLRNEWSFKKLGIRYDNFDKTLWAYFFFTAGGILTIGMYAYILGRELAPLSLNNPHLQYGFIILSALQEFSYRGFLIPKLREIAHSRNAIILLNALIFTFLHIIFEDLQVVLPLVFAGGLGFAYMYIKYPNLILISLSHAALNLVAVMYGFFG